LFNAAETYWRSAGALYAAKVKATHRLSPVLFLYYHAIELYLKAFLRGHGHSAAELRSKFGHRIGWLSDRAAQLGLRYMDEDKEVFSLMSTTDAIIRSRYIRTGFVRWPSPEMLDGTCRNLRESVCEALARKGTPVRL
jgi:hypothetical protein